MDRLPNNNSGTSAPPQYTFISTAESFRKALRHLEASSRLAIDIEADSLYHYFEKVCLIQISSDRVGSCPEIAAASARAPKTQKVLMSPG